MISGFTKSAFTLIELLVVIVIIALLSTLSVVAFGGARSKARDARRLSDTKQIATALEMYYNDTWLYPATPAPLGSPISHLCLSNLGISSTCGQLVYLKKIPADPQKNVSYQYRQLSGGESYRLIAELENENSENFSKTTVIGPSGDNQDLLLVNGIDWRNPTNWHNCTVSWDDGLQAIKAINYQSCIFYPSSGYLPIDTSKKYYIEAEYMTTGATSYGFYLGTISYNESKVRLLGHPGTYDYFGAAGAKPTSTGIWNLVLNRQTNGQPRTGESATTSLYYRWHPGAAFARIYIAANHNGPQTAYIRNIRFYVE